MRLLVVVLLVPACTSENEAPEPITVSREPMVTYQTGTDALWYITVNGDQHDTTTGDTSADDTASSSVGRCGQDPMVAETWPSPDASSATFTVILPPHATEGDAQRIVGCFRQELPATALTLTRPAKQPGQH